MSESTLTRLPSGLRVLTVPMPGTESVTVLTLVGVGSRYETLREQGLSHVLEHMLFKGTKHFPTAKDLSQTLDGVGADYNAFTSKDHTGYYVRVAARHVPLALEVVGDMVWRPLLDASELTSEKKVICEEIKMYEDNPLMHIGDLLEGTVFQGSSLGVNIAGSLQSVTALTRAQVASYHNKYYAPRNMLLVVTGKLPKNIQKLIRAEFGVSKLARVGTYKQFKVTQRAPRVSIQKKPTQQAQLALGFPSYGYRHRQTLPLELLATVLGGNMSSRLFSRLREREGLCYSISAGADQYEGTGTFVVSAGLDTSRLNKAITLIKEELTRVTREPVLLAELNKAKEYIRGKFTLAMENPTVRAQWQARQFWFDHSHDTPQEFLAKLSKVTPVDVARAAADIIRFERASLALIGPFTSPNPWRKLLQK